MASVNQGCTSSAFVADSTSAAAVAYDCIVAVAAELSASKHGISPSHLEVTCNSADASPFATAATAAAAAAHAHPQVSPNSGTAISPRQQQQQHGQGLYAGGWSGLQPVHPLQQQQQQQQQQQLQQQRHSGVPHWMEGHSGAAPGL
jgi:hypothetical protein